MSISLSQKRASPNFLDLPREIRDMIYYQLIQAERARPGCRGLACSCHESDLVYPCWLWPNKDCWHLGDDCKHRAILYLAHPSQLLRVNRQVRGEFSPLYTKALDLYIDFAHLELFICHGLIEAEARDLRRNATRIHVDVDLQKLLSDKGDYFWDILLSWTTKYKMHPRPLNQFAILYDVQAPRTSLHLIRGLKSSVLIRDVRRLLRFMRLPRWPALGDDMDYIDYISQACLCNRWAACTTIGGCGCRLKERDAEITGLTTAIRAALLESQQESERFASIFDLLACGFISILAPLALFGRTLRCFGCTLRWLHDAPVCTVHQRHEPIIIGTIYM